MLLEEVDPTLSLMVRMVMDSKKPKEERARPEPSHNPEEDSKCEELFQFRIQVKKSVVAAIIDPGSQKNLISEALVKELGLVTEPHPHPYSLGWFRKDVELRITKRCILRIAVTAQFIDEVTCEVVPLDICQVMFGNSYLYIRDAL